MHDFVSTLVGDPIVCAFLVYPSILPQPTHVPPMHNPFPPELQIPNATIASVQILLRLLRELFGDFESIEHIIVEVYSIRSCAVQDNAQSDHGQRYEVEDAGMVVSFIVGCNAASWAYT